MPDDIIGLGRASAEVLSLLKEPVKTLFGPAFEQVADAWGDRVRHWRDMKRIDLAIAAVQKLKAKGISPKAVDPHILFPILDAGSLTDDETLKGKWATLLAKASSERDGTILPAFARILSELSPFEALVLDDLSMEGTDEEGQQEWIYMPVNVRDGVERVSSQQQPIYGPHIYEANFVRLGLIQKMQQPIDERDILNLLDHVHGPSRDPARSFINVESVASRLDLSRRSPFYWPLARSSTLRHTTEPVGSTTSKAARIFRSAVTTTSPASANNGSTMSVQSSRCWAGSKLRCLCASSHMRE